MPHSRGILPYELQLFVHALMKLFVLVDLLK